MLSTIFLVDFSAFALSVLVPAALMALYYYAFVQRQKQFGERALSAGPATSAAVVGLTVNGQLNDEPNNVPVTAHFVGNREVGAALKRFGGLSFTWNEATFVFGGRDWRCCLDIVFCHSGGKWSRRRTGGDVPLIMDGACSSAEGGVSPSCFLRACVSCD